MDANEQNDLREFLVTLYGSQARSWQPSPELFDLTFELVSESGECTKAMRFVPRPLAPGRSPFRYLATEVRRKFLRALRENRDHYAVCLSAAANRMAHRFHFAAQGL